MLKVNSCMRGLLALVGMAVVTIWAEPASACAPFCNDANWQHQERIMREQAEQRRQEEELHREQAAAMPTPITPPPEYVAPKPPKGWQQRWTGFVSFPVGNNQDEEGNSLRYDYALAMNYATETEAQAAAEAMCRTRAISIAKIYYGNVDEYCKNQTTWIHHAFLRIGVGQNGLLGISGNVDYERALYGGKVHIRFGNKFYACGSIPDPSPESCDDWVLAIARNGAHATAGNPDDYRIFPCPTGSPDRLYKVIGVDRLTGSDVPLCGPDLAAWTIKDHAGKWDGYAGHPRYILPFVAGGSPDATAAQKAALDLCNSKTGGGCFPIGERQGGFVVVVRNNEAKLFLGTGPTAETALADAQSQCSPGQLLPCKKLMTRIAGDPKPYAPYGTWENLHYFGSAALPNGRVGNDGKVWIAQYLESQADADRFVLQKCQSENSERATCRIVGGGLGATFVIYAGADGSKGVFPLIAEGEDRSDRISAALKKVCAAKGTICTQPYVISADRTPNPDPYLTALNTP